MPGIAEVVVGLPAKLRLAGLALTASVLVAGSGFAADASLHPEYGKLAQRVPSAPESTVRRVYLVLNKSQVIRLSHPVGDVLVGAPDVADVLPVSEQGLYILGKKIGTTNVTMFDAAKKLVGIVDVVVSPDVSSIQEQVSESTGDSQLRVRASGDKAVLVGTAHDAVSVDRAMQAVPPGTVNLARVASPQQVMLKVRFVEINRTAARELGLRWDRFARGQISGPAQQSFGLGSTTRSFDFEHNVLSTASTSAVSNLNPFVSILANLGGGHNLDVQLSALEEKGVVRRLAEPNLSALSGDTAEFLAGGEFPIPVSQSSSSGTPVITVQYKEFGVKLVFTPTVLTNGLINLQLAPEVSDIDTALSVPVGGGISVPGISKRRAKTSVELRDGQSFAIAGLLQTTAEHDINQVPWLGSVPILGTLFRSSAYNSRETELVMLVTPYLVKPGRPTDLMTDPLESTMPPNDPDFFLAGEVEIKRNRMRAIANAKGIAGPYGHVLPAAARAPVAPAALQ